MKKATDVATNAADGGAEAFSSLRALNFIEDLIPPSGGKWLKPLQINILTHSPRFKPWAMFWTARSEPF
ncbi:hypothetical protein [Roseivirga sp.]|uniref:hypothetical protein n=1 Tax=Roseivirga sp. TaxID=1964215 RepID=UPI002B272D39|nr:hypothetical protein [Roseivirga sp.]